MKKLPFDEWISHFPDATESEYQEYLQVEIDSDFTIRSPEDSDRGDDIESIGHATIKSNSLSPAKNQDYLKEEFGYKK
jgi:hypothetical protein